MCFLCKADSVSDLHEKALPSDLCSGGAGGADYNRARRSFHSPPCFLFLSAGFKRKEFRGKLAIAITANFINRNTTAEAKVEEISGVAFIFNQKFFLDLKEETGGRGWKRKWAVFKVFAEVKIGDNLNNL